MLDMMLLITSGVLFVAWLRCAVVLALCGAPEGQTIECRGAEELEAEFLRLKGALGKRRGFEHLMVCGHFRVQQAIGAVAGRIRPAWARRTMEEMRQVIVYLAWEAAAGPAALQ